MEVEIVERRQLLVVAVVAAAVVVAAMVFLDKLLELLELSTQVVAQVAGLIWEALLHTERVQLAALA